jgi:hypothetical protein
MTSCRGSVDRVLHRTVHGWAWDADRPEARLRVWVRVNGTLAGATMADRVRPDLAPAGIGDGAHAYAFPVPEAVGEIRTVEAFLEDGEPLPGPAPDALVDPATNHPTDDAWRPGPGCRFPSFFVLGAAKSGTTSLHDYLGQHPDVCMSDPKEPFFFEAEHDRGAAYYRNRYFAHWRGEAHVGESRHRHLYLPHLPQLLHAHNPDARLVAILRDPVERAVSHWWHWYSRGLEPLGLQAALDADLERIGAGLDYGTPAEQELYRRVMNGDGLPTHRAYIETYRTYLDTGHYAQQLQRYIALFGRERLHVARFEDLVDDPARTVAAVLEHIGADPAPAAGFAYPHRNQGAPGFEAHVTDAIRERLETYYAPHERALAELLGAEPARAA